MACDLDFVRGWGGCCSVPILRRQACQGRMIYLRIVSYDRIFMIFFV